NQGDGWDYTINYLVRFLEDRRSGGHMSEDVHGVYIELAKTLAQRTAELHVALATPTDDPAFKPEELSSTDLGRWRDKVVTDLGSTFRLIAPPEQMPEGVRVDAVQLAEVWTGLERRVSAEAEQLVPAGPCRLQGLKIRHHGDYHLGQVLLRRNDFVIVD